MDQIVYKRMKEEKLYMYKAGRDPEVEQAEAERMAKALAAAKPKEQVEVVAVTPNSTELAQVDAVPEIAA